MSEEGEYNDGEAVDLHSGIMAFEAKHFSRAMQLLSPMAEQGDPEAQYPRCHPPIPGGPAHPGDPGTQSNLLVPEDLQVPGGLLGRERRHRRRNRPSGRLRRAN